MKQLLSHISFYLIAQLSFSQNLSVTNLQCESTNDPLGIDLKNPTLSWELKSDQKNVLQMGYRILVADDPSLLDKGTGNVWDSKKISSAASIQVKYAGIPLQSIKKYFWKVMAWDNKGNSSAWSNTATWQMGLLNKQDWNNAQWIGYDEPVDSLRIVACTFKW